MSDEIPYKIRDEYESKIRFWKMWFGWTLASLIILILILVIAALSNDVQTVPIGYTPEQVTEAAIKICKELRP